MHKARARIDRQNFVHRRDGRARELNLQFEAAPARIGIEIGRIAAAPGVERDLVDRAIEGDRIGLVTYDSVAAAAAKRANRVAKAGDQMSRSSGQP